MNRLESVEAFGTLFLIALALSTAIPWPSAPPVQAAQPPALSQPLTTFTGTLCHPYSPPPFSIDLGSVNWCFSQNQISFADNWTPQHNFTFSIPTVAAQKLGVTTFQNSTTVDYHMSLTFAGRTLAGDIFLKSLGYSQKITIKGSITGSVSTFALAIPFARVDSICDTGCAQVFSNHLGFDWSDSASIASYNNLTRILTFTIGNSFSIDPIAIDTSGSCSHAGATNTCTTATITTTARNDLALAFIWTGNSPPDCEAQAPTSSPVLTWRERNNVGGSASEFCEYYAQWDSAGGITVTEHQAANGKAGMFVIFISDAMIKPPSLDTGLCVNQRGLTTTTTTTITACPLTSYNARDLLIGAFGINALNPTITAGTGFTLVGCVQANALSVCVENQFVSSVQTNTNVVWKDVTGGGNNGWFLSDTVEEFKPDIVQTKLCSFTTTQSPTCAFANNLVAGDTVLVVASAISSAASVSSVTDTQGLTYSKIIAKATSAGTDVEGWWACNVATAAANTVTVNWDTSRSGVVFLYELTPSDASCLVRSSSGSATSTSASVSSYTPVNASLVIAATTDPPATGTITVGTGYLQDGASACGSSCLVTAHATNNGTAETSPMSVSPSAAWNEISMSFVRPTPNALITTSTTTTTTTPTTTTTSTTTTTTSTTNISDPLNYDWLLLIPVVFVLFLVIRKVS